MCIEFTCQIGFNTEIGFGCIGVVYKFGYKPYTPCQAHQGYQKKVCKKITAMKYPSKIEANHYQNNHKTQTVEDIVMKKE